MEFSRETRRLALQKMQERDLDLRRYYGCWCGTSGGS